MNIAIEDGDRPKQASKNVRASIGLLYRIMSAFLLQFTAEFWSSHFGCYHPVRWWIFFVGELFLNARLVIFLNCIFALTWVLSWYLK